MKLVVFRTPVEGSYESKATPDSGTLAPLAFPDVTVAVDRLLSRS